MKVKDVIEMINYGHLKQKVYVRRGFSDPKEVTQAHFFGDEPLEEAKKPVLSLDLFDDCMIINYK